MIFNPTTRQEARKHRYGKRAGFPSGRPYDAKYCATEIIPKGRIGLPQQCCARPGSNGLHCRHHDPTNVAKKQSQLEKKWRRRSNQSEANCARAKEVVSRIDKGAFPHYLYKSGYTAHVVVPLDAMEVLLDELETLRELRKKSEA